MLHAYGPRVKTGKEDWKWGLKDEPTYEFIYPRKAARKPLAPEVPPEYTEDFNEACLVLADSPKSSAALTRRLLQRLLHEHLNIRKGSLDSEIQELLKVNTLPSHIAEAVDAIRSIGNFAAHPVKTTSAGEIVDVEPGEAEWTIEVLESLFDFYFVQPEKLKQKRAALNAKLQAAGKPPIK
jgi:hypothetical protein